MIEYIFSIDFISSVLKISMPLVFGGLAASVVQKGNLINIGIEGMMLLGALFGVLFSDIFGNVWISLVFTIVVIVIYALILCAFVVILNVDSIVAGISFNLIATGLAGILLYAYSGDRGVSTSIPSYKIDSGFFLILSIVLSVATYFLLYKTNFGYKVEALSASEKACVHKGLKVKRIKYTLYGISGAFAALGGFYLSCSYMSMFSEGIISGRGYIVLASSVMAANNPIFSFFTALLFGAAKHIADYLQLFDVSSSLISTIPYLTAILFLSVYGYKKSKK